MDIRLGAHASAGSRVAHAAVWAVAPAVATLWLVHGFLNARVSDFVPSAWNDQTGYWHEISSFAHAGFDSGYYVPNEHVAAAGSFHFDVGSPAFVIAYGSLAGVVGWNLDTSIYLNAVVIALGFVVFCLATRLSHRQIAVAGVVCLAFGPILLYLPTSSQESLNQAIAMLFAAIVSILIVREGQISRPLMAAVISFAVAASLIRYSWAILILAILVLAISRWSIPNLVRQLFIGCLITVGILIVVAAIAAPGGSAPFARIIKVSVHPIGGVRDLLAYAGSNLRDFLTINGVTGLLAVQVAGVIAVSVGVIALGRVAPTERREWTFHLANLGLTLAASLVLYLPLGYYRLIGAHLLLSLLVMVRFRHYLVVGVVTLTMLVATPLFLDAYRDWEPNFAIDGSALRADRAAVQQFVSYDPDASNPWCNTVLIPIDMYDWRVTLMPAGVGVSYILSYGPPVQLPVKSRYVMLGLGPSQDDVRVDVGSLHELATFSFGRLFENPASVCKSVSQ